MQGVSWSYSWTKDFKTDRRQYASYLWQFGHESFAFDRGLIYFLPWELRDRFLLSVQQSVLLGMSSY